MDVVTRPGEGEALVNETRELRVKTATPELVVFEADVGPGFTGASPHFHKEHVDSFHVLEGELEITVGGDTIRAGAGTFVAVPPGVVHSFTRAGSGRVRYLNIHAPGMRFDEYLRARDRGEDVDPADFDVFDVDE